MTNKQLEETLATLATKAKDLREAGVTRVAIGDIELELAEPEPPPPPAPVEAAGPKSEDGGLGNPYDDPVTYGGHIPRRRGAPRVTEDDEED